MPPDITDEDDEWYEEIPWLPVPGGPPVVPDEPDEPEIDPEQPDTPPTPEDVITDSMLEYDNDGNFKNCL